MKRIASFEVNHDKLKPGMYTSRIDGDITTYDIRMVYPNAGTYHPAGGGAYVRAPVCNVCTQLEVCDQIIYCGPMGCQTGFYFLVRDMKPSDAIALVQESMAFIAAYEGEIPGASRIECGNYLLHDLAGAKQLAASMIPVLEGWKEENLIYEK